jgi:hypothetical protein
MVKLEMLDVALGLNAVNFGSQLSRAKIVSSYELA